MSAEFIIYGHPDSVATDRVRLALAVGNITNFEFVSLDMRAQEHKVRLICPIPKNFTFNVIYLLSQKAEHLLRHHWGKVPALRTNDGFALYESRAICRYLVARYSIPLLPSTTDLKALALFEQAQSVEMSYFAYDADSIITELLVKPTYLPGLTIDADALVTARARLEVTFDVLARILNGQAFMAGDYFTLVDIFYIAAVRRLILCGHFNLVRDRGYVYAWWQRCLEFPSVKHFVDEVHHQSSLTE